MPHLTFSVCAAFCMYDGLCLDGEQIRIIFEAVLAFAPEHRAARLDDLCAGDPGVRLEVEKLLFTADGETRALPAGSPPDAAAPESARIGAYEVLRELGRGGMGVVYLARRTDHARGMRVAIKVARPEIAAGEFILRFRQEREILAALDHPNIARFLDGGSTGGGQPYFVMEYVEGVSLDRYADRNTLPLAARIELFSRVCAAVAHAHQRGVVHRDLKPGNILVTGDGVVKLLDFGIAKLLQPGPADLLVTHTGQQMMTPEYASPEQVAGEPVTAACDVYSLGIVLYRLLTGRAPYAFKSRLTHEIVRVICEEEALPPSAAVTQTSGSAGETPESLSRLRQMSPSTLKRELQGDLDAIALKALRKNFLERYPSAKELLDDLDRHARGAPIEAQQDTWPYRVRKFAARHPTEPVVLAMAGAGWATGVVKVDLIGGKVKFFAGMFLVSLIVGYVLTAWLDGKSAAKKMFPFAALFLAGSFAVSLGLIHLPRGSAYTLITAGFLFFALVMLVRFGRWMWRERAGGPLLLKLHYPRHLRRFTAVYAAMLGVCGVGSLLRGAPPYGYSAHPLADLAFYVTFALFLLVLAPRREIRRSGLLLEGAIVPWGKIAAYWWEPARSGDSVLRLKRRRRLPLPATKVYVASEQKADVQTLMDRYLAEWPA